jgi:hypothetical protein
MFVLPVTSYVTLDPLGRCEVRLDGLDKYTMTSIAVILKTARWCQAPGNLGLSRNRSRRQPTKRNENFYGNVSKSKDY